ncbi:E2 ubiquitin-conjugating enzyme [Malassezia cuniculi]|uniref:Ubiquitin-conjugating enzyme E2 6 n=1 Tax=Malassezia cuniculi TaxID=948313 RepID=A0AAF0EQ54_9BASI|nr:E2 ubiquitin-conjugating enzyme [Malassezia cuniculi]
MATKAASKRLGKEAAAMEKDPPPLCYARPREENILEWHFIIRGPPDTPYEGGEYWGQLIFPSDYPFKPPGIKMHTPSGRFQPDTKICTSMSDFHPGSWNPAWSVSSIIIGLQSFMCTDEMTTGSVLVSSRERRALAAQSHAFNAAQRRFVQMFPEYAGPTMKDLPNMVYLPKKAVEAKPSTETSAAPMQDKAASGAKATKAAETANVAEPPAAEVSGNTDPKDTFWRPRNIGIVAAAVVSYLFVSRLADVWIR